MPIKNFLGPFTVLTSTTMSGSLTSSVTDIRYLDQVSIAIAASGNATGAFSVQGSLDYYKDGSVVNTGTWVSLALTPSPALTGSGNILIDMNLLSFPYIRTTYLNAGGSGSLSVMVSGKGV